MSLIFPFFGIVGGVLLGEGDSVKGLLGMTVLLPRHV